MRVHTQSGPDKTQGQVQITVILPQNIPNMPFIVVKGDKHLWDCITQKITGDTTSCVCVLYFCVSVSKGMFACGREGQTLRESDMQRT